jgi:hypothetical protein
MSVTPNLPAKQSIYSYYFLFKKEEGTRTALRRYGVEEIQWGEVKVRGGEGEWMGGMKPHCPETGEIQGQ